jgi:copper chaperone
VKTILNVSGMTCGGCVKHVTDALRPLPGVMQVDVVLREGRAVIEHDERTNVERLIAAVATEGYQATAAK